MCVRGQYTHAASAIFGEQSMPHEHAQRGACGRHGEIATHIKRRVGFLRMRAARGRSSSADGVRAVAGVGGSGIIRSRVGGQRAKTDTGIAQEGNGLHAAGDV